MATRSSASSTAGRRRGSTTPRVYTPPLVTGPPGPCGCGCALTEETSLGFAVNEFAEDVLGVQLMPWQRWWLIHVLELGGDGTLRFRTVVLLVARQNGKSTVLQILSLWFMFVVAAPLVIGTAQDLDTAEALWGEAVELAEETPELADQITRVNQTNGKKALELRGGEKYKVRAASRRGGRGLSGNLVLLDELREHQSWDAWAAVTKTTMAQILALIVAASNAGDASSVVLRYLRKMAHAALGDPDGLVETEDEDLEPDLEDPELDLDAEDLDDDTLGIFEWSAKPGCSIRDRDGWAQANPALGYRIAERTIAAAARTDPEWVFRPEVLCQWLDGTREGPFPPGAWEATETDLKTDPHAKLDDPAAPLCVDVSWDRSTTYIGAAAWRGDGVPQVEVIAQRSGTDWVLDWLKDPKHPTRAKRRVVVQAKRAPASSLVETLRDAGIDVIEWDGVAGTADLYDRVRSAVGEGSAGPQLRHLRQPVLEAAAMNAATRPVGDSWAWDRRKSPVHVAPLVACTGALWALVSHKPKPPPATAPAAAPSGAGVFDQGGRLSL